MGLTAEEGSKPQGERGAELGSLWLFRTFYHARISRHGLILRGSLVPGDLSSLGTFSQKAYSTHALLFFLAVVTETGTLWFMESKLPLFLSGLGASSPEFVLSTSCLEMCKICHLPELPWEDRVSCL